ncbi:MAG TPA: hypothetical protein VMH80_07435 [Bryobacteraceae bacterium]|nr:hypothetical protein [Bryobacteraceae bacterium]
MRYSLVGCTLVVLACGSANAQYVISAHSGVVQYVEGAAYLNGQQVDPKFGHFPDIKDNQEFQTKEGRAEILLTPGVFLRLGENSSIRMLSTRLTDTRVEVLHGSAIIECDDVPKDNSIQVVYNLDTVQLTKHGLYRVDTDPARFRVYDGEAVVKGNDKQVTVKGGKETSLDSTLTAQSFDRKDDDELYRWSDRRASYVAQANAASATTASNSGSGYGYSGSGYGGLGYGGLGYGGLGYGYGAYGFNGGWAFNPMFGMYTYLPFDGFGYSPFGYTFFSPYTAFYAPYYYGGYYGGGGYPVRTSGTATTSRAVTRGSNSAFLGHSPGGFMGGARTGRFGGFAGSSVRSGGFGSARSGGFGGFSGARAGGGFSGAGAGGFGGGHAAGSVGGGHVGGGHR